MPGETASARAAHGHEDQLLDGALPSYCRTAGSNRNGGGLAPVVFVRPVPGWAWKPARLARFPAGEGIGRTIMTFELVKKHSREHDRMASPFEEAALQTVKGGSGDPATRRIYRRLANHVRDNDLLILCVCRGEGSARPVIVPRRVGPDRVNLVNLPHADVPHAEYCVFRLRDAEGSRAIVIPDDFLDPFSFVEGYRNLPGPGGGKERRRDGLSRVPANVSNILKRLIQGARLNTLAGVERFASPGEWLAELRCAAEALYIAPNIPVSELLFTDPGSWSAGEVGRKLDAAERNWPERRRPCGFLCWIAHDVSEYEINSANPSQGHIRVTSPVVFPSVYRRRVSGPYLFLGVVARADDGGRWECRLAYAQPIVDPKCPIPVDSGYERSALDSLPHLVRDLRDDRGLLEALGGTVRVELQKPLFEFNVAGSRCLPDVLVTVTRPGGDTVTVRAGRAAVPPTARTKTATRCATSSR